MTPVIAGSINRTPTGPHRRCDMLFISAISTDTRSWHKCESHSVEMFVRAKGFFNTCMPCYYETAKRAASVLKQRKGHEIILMWSVPKYSCSLDAFSPNVIAWVSSHPWARV